jgi:abortive infection bacteriophage resistance protein
LKDNDKGGIVKALWLMEFALIMSWLHESNLVSAICAINFF